MPVQIAPLTVGFIGIGLLIVLLFSGMPIGFVMALVGFIGITFLSGKDSSLVTLGRVPYTTVASHPFSVLPLFILMGFFVYYSGISKELFDTAYRWIGHFPGGLAMAAVGACAAFSADDTVIE